MEPGSQRPSPRPSGSLVHAATEVRTLEELSGLLRDLRRQHARERRDSPLTYRELAGRTGWSQAAIAEYFTARTLPPTDRFDALIEVLGAGPAERGALADARDRVEENQRKARNRRGAGQAPPAAPDPGSAGAPDRPTTSAPNQLPADTALFAGRDKELGHLLSLARRTPDGDHPGTVVIFAIDGMGGVGKSALAVHAAHRLAAHYPDGQLFLDLYGFAEGKAPRDPGDALAVLLSGLGVPPQRIPADVDARAALYRDRLSGTRTLVVLDNAADEAQVRPLVPATVGCLVLITSRRRLKALDDALPVPLDVLSIDESVALVRQAARSGSGSADEDAWRQIAELCGRLPLALLIASALLRAGGRAWNLRRLLDRLTSRRPGDELAGYTDETRSLSAVFDLSYQALSERQQLCFRRLGLVPGPEVDAYAAAALLDTDVAEADLLVQHLSDHSLLLGVSPGRYRIHDLIQAHACTLAATDPADQREAARGRLLDYYQHTAQRASVLIDRVPRREPEGGVPRHAPVLPDEQAALAWLRIERVNLEAAFEYVDSHALGPRTVASAAGLAQIMVTDGPWIRALALHETAAAVAEVLGDRHGQAGALTDLGRVRRLTGDVPGATDAVTRAVQLYRELGERLGEAGALAELVRVHHLTGDAAGADETLTRALRLYRSLDNRHGQATVLAERGRARYLTGDFTGAGNALAHALQLYQELGNRRGQAVTLSELGRVHSFVGKLPEATDALSHALELNRDLGNRQGQATALTDLGVVRRLAGDYPGAADALSQAVELYHDLGHRHGQALALAEAGVVHRLTGNHSHAAEALTRALQLYRDLGHRGDEAWALNHYAALLLATGDRPRALTTYRQALAVHRELGKTDDEAVSLEGIGECHLASGDTSQGVSNLRRALEIYRRLGMRPDVERIMSRLGDGDR
ncbi:MAG: tetratricopeptide repeat protein [Catenulispora sp.]|nr:tetratricopeptide repeat protein [Catenulispora sp.]